MADLSAFVNRLLQTLRGLVGDEQYSEAINDARAHAGGVEKARRRKEKDSEDDLSEPKAKGKTVILSEMKFSEDGKTGTVQIFPEQGTYQHPWFGELNFDPKFFTDILGNFKDGVYQQDIPITVNLEHESSLSGAVGWFADLDTKEEGEGKDHKITGMWATVNFNERGTALVAGDQYRYFSSEFYPEWVDPSTSKVFTNVLIGGALTNRPFFKGMQPVALLTESKVYAYSEISPFEAQFDDVADQLKLNPEMSLEDLVTELLKQGSPTPDEETPEKQEDDMPGMTEDEVRQFNEMKTQLAEVGVTIAKERTLREAAEAKAASAEAKVLRIEESSTRLALTEFVHANRPAFKGEVNEVVDRLMTRKTKLSEEEFQAELDERHEIASAFAESGVTRQASREGPPAKVSGEFETLVAKKIEAGLSRPEATKAVLSERPDIYESENTKQNRRAVYAERGE